MQKRTYLITASSGIGGETAKLLAQQRANLFVAGRDRSKCHLLACQLRRLGGKADFLAGDLTDPWFAPKLAAACVKQFGRIDGLFNVAGISGRKFGDGPVHECTEEGWTVTLETNATTQYRMCREVVRI